MVKYTPSLAWRVSLLHLYHTFPHLSTLSFHSYKISSKFVQIPFTNSQKYAILYKVKITERQMRWVKLSRIEYPHRPRVLMPSAITVAGLFFARITSVPKRVAAI